MLTIRRKDPQNAILSSKHWRLYERFEGSPLHAAFVARIEGHLEQEAIYSRQVGSQILQAIEVEAPELLESYDQDSIGGLFGMTLWNVLAKRPENWYWIHDDSREGDRASIYFRGKPRMG